MLHLWMAILKKRSDSVPEPDSILVTDIALNPDSLILQPNENRGVSTAVEPADATNKSLIWSSGDTAIATVDEAGKVTAIAAGETFIYTKTADDSGIEGKVKVTVNHLPPPPPKKSFKEVLTEAYHAGSANPLTREGYPCAFVNVRDAGEADLTQELYLSEQENMQSANYLIISDEQKGIHRLFLNPWKFNTSRLYQIINFRNTAFIQGCFEDHEQMQFQPLNQTPAVVEPAGNELWLLKEKGQLR